MYQNITLVAINSKYIHSSLAIYYLKAYSKRDDIRLIDTNINVDTEDIVDNIISGKPELVGFSCYIFNIEKVIEAAVELRRKHKCIIFFGGPEVSYENERMFDYCDRIIEGAGEKAFLSLINGDSRRKIVGEIVENPLEFSPYTDEYFINSQNKIAYFEASRGCPFSCNYCMSSKDRLQLFDIEAVKRELLKFKGKKVKILKFADRTFNAKASFTNEILSFLIEKFSSDEVTFHFEIAPDILRDDTIGIIAKAREGLFQFEAGIQTFNDEILCNTNRKSDVTAAVANIKKLLALGNCHIHSDLILGLSGENMTSFRKSFNCLYSLHTHQMQVGILKVLKGSPLKESYGDEYVFNACPPYEILSTPTLSENDVNTGKKISYLIEKYYNSNRFHTTLSLLEEKYEPFEIFEKLTEIVPYEASLFELYEHIYDFAVSTLKEDEKLINELLKFDYLSSNKSKNLPPIIKREYSKEFKRVTKNELKKDEFCYYFSFNPMTKEKGEYVIFFDYKRKNYVTKLYNYRILDYKLLRKQKENDELFTD